MSPTFPHLRELIADWQQRLRDCRYALRSIGDNHPKAQLLLIHERVLCYLLTRYQRDPEPEPERERPPLMQMRFPQESFAWFTPPPILEPSALHPPRGPDELRAHLRGIHSSLTAPPPRRKPWFFRRRPRPRP